MPVAPSENIGWFKSYGSGYSFLMGPVSGSITKILSNVIGFITLIAGLAFIMYFMIGAINWITAAGDANKTQKARLMIVNALIGLIITVIAYPAVLIISKVLGAPLQDPADLINQLRF